MKLMVLVITLLLLYKIQTYHYMKIWHPFLFSLWYVNVYFNDVDLNNYTNYTCSIICFVSTECLSCLWSVKVYVINKLNINHSVYILLCCIITMHTYNCTQQLDRWTKTQKEKERKINLRYIHFTIIVLISLNKMIILFFCRNAVKSMIVLIYFKECLYIYKICF